MSKRFYIHCADDINKQLFDTESDFNIHIEEIGSDEELLIQLCDLLNEQQNMIENLTKENDNCRNDYHELFSNYVALEEENEQLRKEHKIAIDEMITDYKNLEKENKQLRYVKNNCRKQQVRQANTIHKLIEEKEYYKEYALKYLTEYELYSDDFLNTLTSITGEEDVKKIRKNQKEIIEALNKEGLY